MASIVVNGDTSGAVTLSAPAVAGTVTVTLPATSGTMLTTASSTGVSGSAISSGTVAEAYGGTGTNTGYYGFKNRIINGAMVIDQRNAGASVTPTANGYTLDRWAIEISQASKLSFQQSTVAPAGFTNSMKITSLSAYSITSGDYFIFEQRVEGFNVADLNWGSANASTITLSFRVYSSLTGTFGGALQNSASNRSYPFTYTISSANTWTTISVTIAGDTSGSWNTTTGTGVFVFFGLGVGSTYSGTAGAWAGANYQSATGATSVVGTNGATFYITGVQLEKGSTATSFDYRPYGTELQLCQRYFEKMGGDASTDMYFSGYQLGATDITWPIYYKANKRASPTATVVGTWNTGNNGGINIQGLGLTTCTFRLTPTTLGTTFAHTTGTSTYLIFSAEL